MFPPFLSHHALFCFPTELCRPGGDEKCPEQSTFQNDPPQAAHVPNAATGFLTLPRPGLIPVPIGPAELPRPPPPWPLPAPLFQTHAAQHQCLPTTLLPDQPSPAPAALLAPPAELPPQPAPQHAAGPPAAPPVSPHGTTGTAPHERLTSRAAGRCSEGERVWGMSRTSSRLPLGSLGFWMVWGCWVPTVSPTGLFSLQISEAGGDVFKSVEL